MDFHVEVFEGYAIAKVAIQPVSFLHEHDAARFVIAQKAHHLAELFPTSRLSCLHIDKFTQDFEIVALRVFAEKFQLRGDGETFAFLILARHPCVQDDWSHAVLCRRALTEHACRSPCADSICVSTGVPGLLFRSHASSKRNIVRNASNWSTLRGFPPVVP